MSRVHRFADLDALSRAAADELIGLARAAIAARGRFHVALSGGSTPRRLFQILATRPGALAWDGVELWWGDERCVPPDDEASNERLGREALLERVGAAHAVYPMRCDDGAALPLLEHR